MVLPQRWDEKLITGQLNQVRAEPDAVSSLIGGLLDRFVLRQEEKTTRERARFLNAELERLKVSELERMKLLKQCAQAHDDLKLHSLESDIRRRELELKRDDLENRQQRQTELDRLRHRLEIAELKKKIRDLETPSSPTVPPPVPPQPSREEVNRQKRAALEKRMAEVRAAYSIRIAAATAEPERRRLENELEQVLRPLGEEWSKAF